MATNGLSLHIGLNSVSTAHYAGWAGVLTACEADAEDMARIANQQSMSSTLLLTQNATRDRVSQALVAAASSLNAGDLFFLSYSGHGGQLPDKNGDEPDGEDETWCLYDGQLVDDEIYAYLAGFRPGVRIIVLADSCHSGTAIKLAFFQGTPAAVDFFDSQPVRYRLMSSTIALRTYTQNKDFYDPILSDPASAASKDQVGASVLLISGCMDNQLSADGTFNGRFTAAVLKVWANGAFKGSYQAFYAKILQLMPPDQSPNWFPVGQHDPVFYSQKPFTV